MPIEKIGVPTPKKEIEGEISEGVKDYEVIGLEKYEDLIKDSFLKGLMIDTESHITEADKKNGKLVIHDISFEERSPYYDLTVTVDINGRVTTKFRQLNPAIKSRNNVGQARLIVKNGPEFDLSEKEIQGAINGVKKSIEHNLKYNEHNGGAEHYESLLAILDKIASNISKDK